VLVLGANDVCDLLDKHETLRRSFPQLLSIRDLDKFINQAVNKDVVERSASALSEAKTIVNVFVPTKAYSKAWNILNKHNFVALEGPPEVGKTAIAWMIGLSLLSNGWESLVCDTPDDFFRQYVSESEQVFIADDAFGRTEYDPTRGKEWERLFARVVGRLDKKHWLIWTSRKYILERAMKSIDLQGQSRELPNTSAVLVDAGDLSLNEKALMLYRHARALHLEEKSKNILRKTAAMIINNPSFTPERIRRFVIEVLPELAHNIDDLSNENVELLRVEIKKAIETPTDRMKKTFDILSEHHKLLLMLLLESENNTTLETLGSKYSKQILSLESNGPKFEDVIDELSESFIRIADVRGIL